MKSKKLAVFEGRKIRRHYDEKNETWYFSVIDIIAALIQQPDYQAARKYWNKLKERAGLTDWQEGFYLWRHLGATAYASRPGTGIAHLRTFLGHGKSNVADEYMKPLTPEIKDVVRWVNQMLDSDDLNAWRKE